jgi:hypothetical protein
LVHLLAQAGQPLPSHQVDVPLGLFGPVSLVFFGRGLLMGFGGQGGVLEINRDHTRGALGALPDGGGDLQHAQTAHKVDVKRRAHRIAPVARAEDAPSGLAQKGIIHGHHQGLVCRTTLFHLGAHLLENLSHLQAILGIEAIIRRPILLGPVLVAQEAGDGVPAKPHQVGKAVAAATGPGLRRNEGAGALLDQALDFLEEGSVFFKSMGLGGT